MALEWNFNEKIGEIELWQNDRMFTINLYQGNAFLIMLHEYKSGEVEKWEMWGFFMNETHAKRMLGIDKRYRDTYGNNPYEQPYQQIRKIRLSNKYRYRQKLIDMLLKAFKQLTIEIYTEEGGDADEKL